MDNEIVIALRNIPGALRKTAW